MALEYSLTYVKLSIQWIIGLYYTNYKIKELEFYLLRLSANYLDYRKQVAYCEQNHPSLQYISKGMPQGSVLGPLLFLFISMTSLMLGQD